MAGRERGECKRIQTRFLPSDDLKQLCLQSRVAKNRGIKKELSFQKTPEMEIIKSSHTCYMYASTPAQPMETTTETTTWRWASSCRSASTKRLSRHAREPFFSAGIRAIHLHYLNLWKRIGAYRN